MGPETVIAVGKGSMIGAPAGYAYLIPWGQAAAPRTLAQLQQGGLRVRMAMEPFVAARRGGAGL